MTFIPKSFPTAEEKKLLRLLLSQDSVFEDQWRTWKKSIEFDDIDFASLQLLPLLYLKLKDSKIQGELFGRIKGVYRLAWVKNQIIIKSLSQVLHIFQINRIDSLLLKGVPILLIAHRNIGARFMGDADIMIHKEQAVEAINLLLENGWRSQVWPEAKRMNASQVKQLIYKNDSAAFLTKENIELDLHFQALHFLFDEKISASHWKDAQAIEVMGQTSKMMCPEDLLIHVIYHGSLANLLRPIRWVVDAMAIINNFDIDWNKTVNKSKQYNIIIYIATACRYLKDEFDANIPDSAIEELYNQPFSKRELAIYRKLSESTSQKTDVRLYMYWKLYWVRYWQFENKHPLPQSFYYFLIFLKETFGLSKTWHIIPFTFRKLFKHQT